jgi:hypothetical protein
LQIAKKNGIVKWSDISKDIYELHGKYYLAGAPGCQKAEGFNTRSSEFRAKFYGVTMAEYLRWLWNNPQNGQNPYKMFGGIIVPIDSDEEGNLIYRWNGAAEK